MRAVRQAVHRKFADLVRDGDLYCNDGDWDVCAHYVADDIDGVINHDEVRRLIRQSMLELADGGNLTNPGAADSVADAVIDVLETI